LAQSDLSVSELDETGLMMFPLTGFRIVLTGQWPACHRGNCGKKVGFHGSWVSAGTVGGTRTRSEYRLAGYQFLEHQQSVPRPYGRVSEKLRPLSKACRANCPTPLIVVRSVVDRVSVGRVDHLKARGINDGGLARGPAVRDSRSKEGETQSRTSAGHYERVTELLFPRVVSATTRGFPDPPGCSQIMAGGWRRPTWMGLRRFRYSGSWNWPIRRQPAMPVVDAVPDDALG
jgi:hypothetical protein